MTEHNTTGTIIETDENDSLAGFIERFDLPTPEQLEAEDDG